MMRKILLWGFDTEKGAMVMVANEIAQSLGLTSNMAGKNGNFK